MIKIYLNNQDFNLENKTIINNDNYIKQNYINYNSFSIDSYIIKIYDNDSSLYLLSINNMLYIKGDSTLINEAISTIVNYKLNIKSIFNNELSLQFINQLNNYYQLTYKLVDDKYVIDYIYKTFMVAGGCFWCMAKPYNEYDGVISVKSGYAGGVVFNPTYKEVKSQTTGHKEVIKIIYDSKVISFDELLKIYFESIDPFDETGQFIDKGESYTTAVFTNDINEINIFNNYVKYIEDNYNKKVYVKLLNNDVFYLAEEEHQDFATKNKEEFEHEEEISGRLNYQYIKIK